MVRGSKAFLQCLIFFLIWQYGNGANCGGMSNFEKLANTSSTEAIATLFSGFQGQPITADCLGLCRQSHECIGFVVDYSSEKCLSVMSGASTVSLEDSFQTRNGVNFFRKICLDSVSSSCNTLLPWILERIRGFRPHLPVAHQYNNVNTSDDCSALCLAEKSFSCYSATHQMDRGICLLHTEHVTSYPTHLYLEDLNKVHYIENLCSTKISNECRYFSRGNVTIGTVDAITNANSERDCQKACDRSSRTVCRSYGFERSTRSCALSGDGLIAGTPNLGMIVGEKSCVPESCSRDSLFYERTIGSTLRNLNSPEKAFSRDLVSTCLERCSGLHSGCSAVVVDHSKMQCQIFQENSKVPGANVSPSPIHSLFEQVCLPAAREVCRDKAWVFERVPGHELIGSAQSRLISEVISRSDCEDACLREATFQCRSANYDTLNSECTLNADDRRTQPRSLVASNRNIEYLENQCLLAPSIDCPFVREENGFPTYIDAIRAPVTSEEECQQVCTSTSSFTCRVAGFRVTTSECLLSGIDQINGGQEAIQNRLGTVYFQRQCPSQESVTLQPNADFSPFPTFTHKQTTHSATTRTQPHSTTTTKPLSNNATSSAFTVANGCPRNSTLATYEKTTGYELEFDNAISLYSSEKPGITEQCIQRCLLDSHCHAFTLDYANIRCYTGSLGNKTKFDLKQVNSHSFFELMCLQESKGCEMLWSFERVLNYGLTNHFLTVIPNVSKTFCEERCLNETRFVCRSATYDYNMMECRLSAENRFTKPEDFKSLNNTDYIENQCAEFSSTSETVEMITTPGSSVVTPSISPRDTKQPCYFSNRVAGKFLKISDRNVPTQSETECSDACLLSNNFICQSYSYLPKSSGYSECLLSSGTTESLGIRLQDIETAVYVEKVCESIDRISSIPSVKDSPEIIVVPLPISTTRPPCTMIDYSLERTTGVAPINQSFATALASTSTTDCVRECVSDHRSCISFVQIMGEPHCQSFPRPFDHFELTVTPGAIYYEKVCLKAFGCGKLWVFERVMGHELLGNDNRVINDVINREECEDWCLREGAFICRSADYDYVTKQCRLSKESRHSRPNDFRPSGSHVDYMENQCTSS